MLYEEQTNEDYHLYVRASEAEKNELLAFVTLASKITEHAESVVAELMMQVQRTDREADLQDAKAVRAEVANLKSMAARSQALIDRIDLIRESQFGDGVAITFEKKDVMRHSVAMETVVRQLTEAGHVFDLLHEGFQQTELFETHPEGASAICGLVGRTLERTSREEGEDLKRVAERFVRARF